MSRQRLYPLLKRAAMTIYAFNTGVVCASDKTDRRLMVSSPHDLLWGDCVALYEFLGDATWQPLIYLSPARARILAAHLIAKAEYIEKNEGAKNIDKATGE